MYYKYQIIPLNLLAIIKRKKPQFLFSLLFSTRSYSVSTQTTQVDITLHFPLFLDSKRNQGTLGAVQLQ